MNYSMGSGIIRYIRASKTFSKFRAFRSSVRFEVQCASKFRVLRSSVRFEVPCGNLYSIIPKTKKFGCEGRGDLTLLFFSKVVK